MAGQLQPLKNNGTRIEIRSKSEGSSYFTPANQKLLEEQGVNVERIQWQDRLFIPNSENGLEVFSRIIASTLDIALISSHGLVIFQLPPL